MPQEYVTTERFEDHLEQSEKEAKSWTDRIIALEKEVGQKVSWTVFWSIISVLVTLSVVAFSVLYSAVKDTQKISTDTQGSVSYIKGVLDNAKITK